MPGDAAIVGLRKDEGAVVRDVAGAQVAARAAVANLDRAGADQRRAGIIVDGQYRQRPAAFLGQSGAAADFSRAAAGAILEDVTGRCVHCHRAGLQRRGEIDDLVRAAVIEGDTVRVGKGDRPAAAAGPIGLFAALVAGKRTIFVNRILGRKVSGCFL